jgi:hypothetical protein
MSGGCRSAGGGTGDYFRVLHQAERLLGMRGFLVESNHHGCHVALFIRESAVRVTEQRHDRQPPWWHALARVVAEVGGCPAPVSLVSAHLAPSSPAIRLAGAETLSLLAKDGLVIAAGDWNAAPAAGTCLPPEGVNPA